MIRTILQISLLRLWHNKPELLLTFVVPILFFSIFAWIFGSRGSSGATPLLKVAICDEENSGISQATIRELDKTGSVRLHPDNEPARDNVGFRSLNRKAIEDLVQRGQVNAAIVFKATANGTSSIEILTDSFDQVAGQVIFALVQKSSIAAQIDRQASVNNQTSIAHALNQQSGSPSQPVIVANATTPSAIPTALMSVASPSIAMIDVLGKGKSNPMIAMYAAGIAVMFVLFSASTAGGSLLEEREHGTLERLLSSGMTVDHLLMGKWLYLALIGIIQTVLMFGFGAAVFGLSLWKNLEGFIAMTIVTASAAAAFALMLAAMCRSRTQLGWVSTIIILSMSALGGSMVPRYLMSESIQRVGQFTFNAWALDGYNKVFWRELPLSELKTELMVLVASGFVFILCARIFASRWDRN